ncbi:unnamed protein product, partial [Staurois parvus]
MLEYRAGRLALLCRRTCTSVQRCPAFTGCLLSLASLVWAPSCDRLRLHSRVPTAHAREVLCFVNGLLVFWDLSRVPQDYREDNSSEVGVGTCQIWVPTPPAPQRSASLVISCTLSAVSGHLLYCVRSLWSSPVLCLQ